MNKRALFFIALVVIGVAVFYFVTSNFSDNNLIHGLTAAPTKDAASHGKNPEGIEQNFVFPQKTEFVAKMRRELALIQDELSRYSAQLAGLDGPVDVDEQRSLDAARKIWRETNRHLDVSERATEFNWYSANRDFRRSYAELKKSIEETRRWSRSI